MKKASKNANIIPLRCTVKSFVIVVFVVVVVVVVLMGHCKTKYYDKNARAKPKRLAAAFSMLQNLYH